MKRLSPFLLLLGAVLVAAVCVRLGLWQLSRLDEKRELNRRLRESLLASPIGLDEADALDPHEQRVRVSARGTYDESHQFLLMGRAFNGEPGVGVVTPLRPEGGGAAVLVNRGWIPSIDGATAQPERFPAKGIRTVVGITEPLPYGGAPKGTRYLRVEIDTLAVWSTQHLVGDSVAARLPYAVRPYVLRALPDRADSIEVAEAAKVGPFAGPIRWPVRPYDETVHKSYAGQWFAFAAITLIGSIALVVRGRRKA